MLVPFVLLALPFTAGCGAARSPAVRSARAGAEEEIVLTRRPRAVVEVNEAAFEAAMFRLAADVHAPPRPFEGRLVYAAWQPQGGGVDRELVGGFRRWCGWKQSSAAKSGCESILEGDGRWLRLDTREAMALSIAMSSVWDGAVEVVKGMVDPAAFQAMVYTSLATCMALLLVPEPVTKALMVAITVGLCTYLGWSTVWGILKGWQRLRAEAGEARTFDELSAAGERFGKLLGANTARVMVMVTTMALGSAAGAAMKGAGAGLPGWGQAAPLAAAEGLAPALVAPVASVLVVGETLTIGMAAGSALAMSATSPYGSSGPNVHDPGELAARAVPQGLTPEMFGQLSQMVRQEAGHISQDIAVHGSRAAGTAKASSDIDIAIRVPSERFDELIRIRFGTPNPGSAKERTMLHAVKTGKIQAGEAGLGALRIALKNMFGIDVDVSVIRMGGPFDNGPYIPLR